MTQRAPEFTGSPTGRRGPVARFPDGENLPCKYQDGYIGTSVFDIRNHYTAYHGEGGPREDPRGRYAGLAGEHYHTLPEKVASVLNSRNDLFIDKASGMSFTSPQALAAHQMARRHKGGPGTMKPVTGDKSLGVKGGYRA